MFVAKQPPKIVTMASAAIAAVDVQGTLMMNAAKFATCSCMNVIAQHATMMIAIVEFPMTPSTVVRVADQCVKTVLEIHI